MHKNGTIFMNPGVFHACGGMSRPVHSANTLFPNFAESGLDVNSAKLVISAKPAARFWCVAGFAELQKEKSQSLSQ